MNPSADPSRPRVVSALPFVLAFTLAVPGPVPALAASSPSTAAAEDATAPGPTMGERMDETTWELHLILSELLRPATEHSAAAVQAAHRIAHHRPPVDLLDPQEAKPASRAARLHQEFMSGRRDPDPFLSLDRRLHESADALAGALERGDRREAVEQFKAVVDACFACHERYREEN